MNKSENFNSDPKYLVEQLITARKEINNLRQQIKSLRYVHERDVSSIKRQLGSFASGSTSISEDSASSDAANSLRCNEPSTSNAAAAASCKDDTLSFRPIGTISTWFPNKRGTPRQSVVCGRAPGKITLFKSILTNPQHALEGLADFSHMWILFHFHKNEAAHVRAKVAPPRLNGTRTGVFSTRSPHRPCPIGLSLVKIIKVEDDAIYFEGVDMIDQTPVLDVKPYIPQYDNPVNFEKALQSASEEALRSDVASSLDTSFGPSSLANVLARDEQLALRLQAEEFAYNSMDNENVLKDLAELGAIASNGTSANRAGHDAASSSSSSDELEMNDNNDERPSLRNSRLLDGADGPSTVCGTDLDLISRRALNLRIDDSSSSSSPIRMGVREAPDGEEGFDLSQASSNTVQTSTAGDLNAGSQQLVGSSNNNNNNNNRQAYESIVEESVWVPDWISRPATSPLAVVFNERSLQQLRDILNDKADEKRQAVENVLKEDPRSVYLRQRYGNQFYTFLIHELHITCRFDDDRKVVTVFQVRHAGRKCECGLPEWQCSNNHEQ